MRIRDMKDGERVFIITGHDSNPANLYIKEVYLMKGILQLTSDGWYTRVDKPEDSFMKYFIGYDINGNYYQITPITTFKEKYEAEGMLRLWLKNAYNREMNHIHR